MSARVFRTLVAALALMTNAPAPLLACGGSPILGVEIDRLLATGDARKIHQDIDTLRTQIASLSHSGDDAQARNLEEDVMRLLGFEKIWLRCGEGTFTWIRIKPKP